MLSDYKELDSLIGDYLEMRRAYKIRTSYNIPGWNKVLEGMVQSYKVQDRLRGSEE